MSTTRISNVLVAAVAGAAGAAAVLVATRGDAVDPAGEAALAPAAAPATDPELLRRLEELELRLARLESRPVPARHAVAPPRSPDASRWSDVPDASARGAGAGAGDDAAPVVDRDAVEAALLEIRAEERRERERKEEAERERRFEDVLSKVSERLALQDHQVEELRQVWVSARHAREELQRLGREGATDDELRLAKETEAREHLEAIERVLTPAQFAELRELWGGKGLSALR